jgi:hypothetical protein
MRYVFASKTKDGPQEVSFQSKHYRFLVMAYEPIRQIDVLSWVSRTALELIGQSGFGYSFDDLTEDAVPHAYAVVVNQFS